MQDICVIAAPIIIAEFLDLLLRDHLSSAIIKVKLLYLFSSSLIGLFICRFHSMSKMVTIMTSIWTIEMDKCYLTYYLLSVKFVCILSNNFIKYNNEVIIYKAFN